MKKYLITMVLLLLGSSIITAGDVEESIKKLNRDIEKFIVAGDVESQINLYTDDAYSLPNFSPTMHGKDEFLAAHQQGEAMNMKVTKFTLESVDIIDGKNFAIDIGKYSLTMTRKGMPAPIEDAGKYVTVYEKQEDGSLKVKVETWNADNNPMKNMAAGEEHSKEHSGEHD